MLKLGRFLEMVVVLEGHGRDGNLAELQVEIVSVCGNKTFG
jgi:hypothetical protein